MTEDANEPLVGWPVRSLLFAAQVIHQLEEYGILSIMSAPPIPPPDLLNWGESKLAELSVEALRSLCSERNIDAKSRLKKDELVALLLDWKKKQPSAPKEATSKRPEGKQPLIEPKTTPTKTDSASTPKKSPKTLMVLEQKNSESDSKSDSPSFSTTSPLPPTDLTGWGEAKLSELKRDELILLCQQRQLITKSSDTKETLVHTLLKWKRSHEKGAPSPPSSPPVLVTPTARASGSRLQVLTLNELKEWCRKKELPCGGTKAELAERLCAHRGGISLQKLSLPHLKDICEAESLSATGTRADLILRLSTTTLLPLQQTEKYDHKAESRGKKLTEIFGPMSKPVYRKRLEALGLIEPDQDIFHIIASANGGADHSDNYHFAQNRAFNRAIGDKFDHINCYLVGIEKAKKAVAVSVQLNQYKGPSAEELYKKGEAFWRDRRTERRNTEKKKAEKKEKEVKT